MAQTIKLKRSAVTGNVPTTSQLELGELAINTYDGKVFIKKNDGTDSVVEVGSIPSGYNNTNWDTAYGWGDHSTQGYLTTYTDTTYSTATSSVLGLVKIGYAENGKNYPVELSDGQMFVNVPWVDTNTNTTYSTNTAYGTSMSGTEIRQNGGEIPSSANLNDYRTQGTYCQNSNSQTSASQNYPENLAGILIVADDMYGNGLHTTQIYDIYNSQNIYSRSYYNGSWTAWRNLAQDTDTVYTHPTHPGDDLSVDTGALTGATVISDLDFNVTTDTLGHVTDANATYSTRNLTAANIGAAPASHSHSNYLPKTGGTVTGGVTFTSDTPITTNNNMYINRKFTMIENASPQYILLCANAGANDVNGSITMDRTSGNWQAVRLEVVVSGKSAEMVGGTLRTLQVLQNSEDYRLVTITYGGQSWVAIKYTGNSYPMTTGAYFTGRLKSSIANSLTVVNSTGVTDEASFGGTSESYNQVSDFIVSGDVTAASLTTGTNGDISTGIGGDVTAYTNVSASYGYVSASSGANGGFRIGGTRKDLNWDTAYGWGDHSDANYIVGGGTWTGGTGSSYTTLAQSVFASGNTKFTFYGNSGKMDVITDGEFYASEGASRVFHDTYHPNADKWTTARTNTVTLTGDASGSGSASVDGTGNWTVSVPVVVNNDSHAHSNYILNNADDSTSGSISTAINKYFGYASTYRYTPYTTGGIGTRSELISAANFLIHADTDGSGVAEFVSIRAGAGTANELKLLSKTSAAGVNNQALTLNGNKVFNDAYHPNADKWTTARSHTVTLTGDVTGSATQSVDGTGNKTWSISTSVGNDSHNHDHADGNFTASRYFQRATGTPTNNLGSPTVTEMALFDRQFNNKTEFYPVEDLRFYTSTDGVTWTEFAVSDDQKEKFLHGDANSGIVIPNQTEYFRIELDNNGSYVYLNALYMYWSGSGNSTTVKLQKKAYSTQAWSQHTNSNVAIGSWPGHMYLPFNTIPFHPSTHYDAIRIDFEPNWGTQGNGISLYAMQIWGGYPSGRRNVYYTDQNHNVDFPNQVKGASLRADSYQVGTTTIVDGSRNLSNIGTISSTGSATIAGGLTLTGNNSLTAYAGNFAYLTVGSSNKIKFANNDYIRYDDVANRFHFDADSGTSNASLQASTFVGALSGNASTSSKWATARTLSLTGDVTGSVSWDGSGNASITATVANDSHSHSNYVAKSGDTMTGPLTIDTGSSSSNALTLRGSSPTLNLIDEGSSDDFYIHVNSNNFYVLRDTAGADSVGTGWDSPHPLQLEGDTNIGYLFSSRIFADNYHPNADKWTTARTNTVTLTGDATGSGSASVDGSGNWTVSVPVDIKTYKGQNNDYVESSTSTTNRGNFGAGVWAYSGYSAGDNRPFTYDATLQVMPTSGMGFEIAADWLSQTNTPLKVRSLRDCCQGWSSWINIFTDGYHPNADKWTTARSHTVTLTGQVTGSATQSVDGTGNKTWSIATTLNDSALDDQYVTVGSRHSGNADSLIQSSKASIRIWDVSTASDDPSGSNDGLVLSAGWDSSNWGIQQYHDFHSNDLYIRSKQNGTMSSWNKICKEDSSGNLTTSGDIVSGSGGDISTGASGNINSFGNITATYGYVKSGQGGFYVQGTQIVDSARNLLNIGTISCGNITGGDANFNHIGVRNTSSTSGDGISLYGGATGGLPTYGMAFAGTATYGTYGGVTSDWATYFTMSNTTSRGWIFRRGNVNVASIDGGGHAEFTDRVTAPALYADILYDKADVSTYMRMDGDSLGVRIGTSNGYLQVGSRNSGWVHYETDRAGHYFYEKVRSAGTVSGNTLSINETTVVDASRNISGASITGTSLTSTGNATVTGNLTTQNGNVNAKNGLQINGTTVVDSSRNATFGTIQGENSNSTAGIINLRDKSTSPGFTFIKFQNTDGTTTYGSIYRQYSSIVYATSSDYRLKENVVQLTSASDRVNALSVKRFNFIEHPEDTVDGFLAHEVQEVVPQAVLGNKDGVDKYGRPEYQSIDHSKLVPLLTAGLQEALAEIENLKARLSALEN